MSSPKSAISTLSDSSRSSSPSSDLSTLDSVSTGNTDADPSFPPQHVLALSNECKCLSDLDCFLRSLPLRSCIQEYLILALPCTEMPIVERQRASNMADCLRSVGRVLGKENDFEAWSSDESDKDDAKFLKSVQSGDVTVSPEIFERILRQVDTPLIITYNEALVVFASSGLHVVYSMDLSPPSGPEKAIFLLERAPFSFPSLEPILLPTVEQQSNPFGLPTRMEWQKLWAAWDLVTLEMIPPCMLHQKPIDLRHKCLFYIGHIPTFVNMLLSHLFKEPYTEPKNFTTIFERGIDPHVDDPEYCHSHSDVPVNDEDWPVLDEVLAYRDRVRARLMVLYDDLESGKRSITKSIARVLQMTLEHEGFHIETLLYMLIQRAGSGTLPPPGFTRPPWAALAAEWASVPKSSSQSVAIAASKIIMGHDDCELDDVSPCLSEDILVHEFGWDNESPKREVSVGAFRIDWRPITNGEYHSYWNAQQISGHDIPLPASWDLSNGDIFVRSVYGPVPLSIAQTWPVLASYDELSVYAKSKGGRIPTELELRLFFDKYEVGFDGGANVGFRNWHPVPATTGVSEVNDGKGSNGGVWEWTSTEFAGHDGFVGTKHFPGYSSDFFDGVHQVVLGASYATMPRLAGRRTLRNFYQHNYPYAWVSARVAFDNVDEA